MRYDDADISCTYCSLGMDAAALCEHDDPMCPKCCAVNGHEDELLAKWAADGWAS